MARYPPYVYQVDSGPEIPLPGNLTLQTIAEHLLTPEEFLAAVELGMSEINVDPPTTIPEKP